MSRPILSVIIPVRNRSGVRLENCLRSLRWQELPEPLDGTDIEVVISDFGSESPHKDNIAALGEAYDTVVVRTNTDDIWNRSRVLNIGIRASRGKYIFCTDADMMFQPNFLAEMLAVHEQNDNAMVVCRCHDLPERVPEQLWERDKIEWLVEQATVRTTPGTGACQSADRRFFEYARGYDEGYKYWGSEDKDMLARAKAHGLDVCWLNDKTAMVHQWHPTMSKDRMVRVYLNRFRYKLTKNKVVKNRRGWGQ